MRVVPERASLVLHIELIAERIPRDNGTLSHESSSVKGIRMVLEEAVPMLCQL
jgi:hypothetical protein